ncbi:peptidoglycan DD-metalloendopeptidase family protein [Curtobacterium sp. RRHDQ10]|uniref:peptidoglycan DD-metalloendopeptidase family protein n=1 Tax=Curtobacterium phyllosphaerae TaxID=3413379 RepID=UPI003BF11E99
MPVLRADLRRGVRVRRGLRVRVLALAAVVALAGGLLTTTDRADAATYPSWDDVMAARGQTAATQTKVGELQTLLTGLRDRVSAAQAEADRLGGEFQQAQQAADAAAARESALRADADEHAAIAEDSAAQAGQFAAQLSRGGGASVTASLMSDGRGAKDLLYDLGAMSKLTEHAQKVETAAVADAAVARSLTAQADRAASALDALATEAETRMAAAQQASDAVQAQLAEQNDNEARLQAQLATLRTGQEHTEAEYAKGEQVRIAAAAAEAKRQADAARAAAAAAAARAATSGGSSSAGPGPGSGGVGSGSGSGWVRPGGGGISSAFGYRIHPITGVRTFHEGVDLASGCSTAIVAAASGTVDYVGRYGGYGNYVRVDHGGVKTAYGHIVDGGFRVRKGQHVEAGQLVALVGSTGNSTGCHLHFEVRPGGGSPIDPVPYMAARGVSLR